nr:unnamed protein product [Digitaria exilis]
MAAATADANATVPSPPPLPPSPASQRAAAVALVQSRRELAATAVTVVIYLILAMAWLLFVRRVGHDVCGDGCPVFDATDAVLIGTTVSLVVLGVVAAACTIFLACCMNADKAPDPNVVAAADQSVLRVLILGMLAFLGIILLTLAGFLLEASSPGKGSITETSASVIIDAAVVSLVLLNCFVLLPAMTLFAWNRMLVIWQRL